MNTGWIKMHRQIMDKSWYSKPSYVSMWATLLLLATHRGMEVWFAGKPVKLKPGQLITGRKSLAKLTGIHESSVQRILSYFENIEHQIEQRISNQNRLITVINWDRYQGIEHQIEHPVNIQRTPSEHPVNTNKNDKNVDNDNNVNVDPQKSEIEHAKDFIIETFNATFFNSLGVYWKGRIKKHIDANGLQGFKDAILRFKRYHDENFDMGFAQRFSKFEQNPCFYSEAGFEALLAKHRKWNGKESSGIELKPGFIPQDRSKALDKMVKDVGSAGGKHDRKN